METGKSAASELSLVWSSEMRDRIARSLAKSAGQRTADKVLRQADALVEMIAGRWQTQAGAGGMSTSTLRAANYLWSAVEGFRAAIGVMEVSNEIVAHRASVVLRQLEWFSADIDRPAVLETYDEPADDEAGQQTRAALARFRVGLWFDDVAGWTRSLAVVRERSKGAKSLGVRIDALAECGTALELEEGLRVARRMNWRVAEARLLVRLALLGEDSDALTRLLLARDAFRDSVGEVHPDVAGLYVPLGVRHERGNDADAARSAWLTATKLYRSCGLVGHPSYVAAMRALARADRGSAAAKVWLLRALRAEETSRSSLSRDAALIQVELADAEEDDAEAIQWCEIALGVLELHPEVDFDEDALPGFGGGRRGDVALCLNRLALRSGSLGMNEERAYWFGRALAHAEAHECAEPGDYENLARAEEALGNIDSAARWQGRCVASAQEKWGLSHPQSIRAMCELGRMSEIKGDTQAALEWYRRVVEHYDGRHYSGSASVAEARKRLQALGGAA